MIRRCTGCACRMRTRCSSESDSNCFFSLLWSKYFGKEVVLNCIKSHPPIVASNASGHGRGEDLVIGDLDVGDNIYVFQSGDNEGMWFDILMESPPM